MRFFFIFSFFDLIALLLSIGDMSFKKREISILPFYYCIDKEKNYGLIYVVFIIMIVIVNGGFYAT